MRFLPLASISSRAFLPAFSSRAFNASTSSVCPIFVLLEGIFLKIHINQPLGFIEDILIVMDQAGIAGGTRNDQMELVLARNPPSANAG